MLSVVCFKWGDKYTAEHVNILRHMVARHYAKPHRFICVTNDAEGLEEGVEVVPDREDFKDVPSPHGAGKPSCYRRLRLWEPDAAETFGDWVVTLDLDTVIVRDMAPIWDRDTAFTGWADPMNKGQYNASMYLLLTGSYPSVWRDFNPATSPAETAGKGFRGSDQGWISSKMWASWPKWTRADGVLSYKVDCKIVLPKTARIVFFHGNPKPWSTEVKRHQWIKDNWK